MRVRVYGGCSYLTEDEVRYAVEWLGRRLMDSVSDEVSVSIQFRDDGMGVDMARMMPKSVQAQTRRFSLEVCNRRVRTPRMLYLVLCHEIVHVWQYATRAIEDDENGELTRWRTYLLKNSEFGYHDMPWEVEAHRMEKGLYAELSRHLRERAGKRRKREIRDQNVTLNTAEVVKGRQWYNVVFLTNGRVIMALPVRTQDQADRLVDEWTQLGLISMSAMFTP
jgi:hypothetical protein